MIFTALQGIHPIRSFYRKEIHMKHNTVLAPILFLLLAACSQKQPARQAATGFDNTKDFVCGMQVQADFTDTCQYAGKVYGFCSASCLEDFKAAPEKFLGK
jgi:YHS domain-containing protein